MKLNIGIVPCLAGAVAALQSVTQEVPSSNNLFFCETIRKNSDVSFAYPYLDINCFGTFLIQCYPCD